MRTRRVAVWVVAAAMLGWGGVARGEGEVSFGVSERSSAVRLDVRDDFGGRLVHGTETMGDAEGGAAAAWDTTLLADGWQEVTQGAYAATVAVKNASGFAVEEGRMAEDATWGAEAVHTVRNWVTIPSGRTLEIGAGAVVKFTKGTGIRVDPGGTLRFAGTAEAPITVTAAEDDAAGGDTDMREETPENGSYVLNVLGTATDTGWTETKYANLGSAGALKHVTVTIGNAIATWTNGMALIPVFVSGTRTTGFHALWEAVDGTAELGRDYLLGAGALEWTASSQGTKYISIPLDPDADPGCNRTFQIRLTKVYGGAVGSAGTATVTLYSRDSKPGERPVERGASEWSEAVRMDMRDDFGGRLVHGTETLGDAEGGAAVAWDTTLMEDGWQEVTQGAYAATVAVKNAAGFAVEEGRLGADATWGAEAVHAVRNWVTIPSGRTLEIGPGAVVKFTKGTGIRVDPGGTLRFTGTAEAPITVTAAEDDSAGGDTDMREEEPVSGSYILNVLGTATDTGWTETKYANLGSAGSLKQVTVTIGNAIATWENGAALVPVFVSGTRTTGFHALWEAVDGTAELGRDYLLGSGSVEWTASSQGTKYLSIPLDPAAETTSNRTFQIRLTKVYGGSVGSAGTATVTLHGCASKPGSIELQEGESEWSGAVRIDERDDFGGRLVHGTEMLGDPDGGTAEAWDTTQMEDGWHELTRGTNETTVAAVNASGVAVEYGRLAEDVTWGAEAVHVVRNWVAVPSGRILEIGAGTVVKFTRNTGIRVEAGGTLRFTGTQDAPITVTVAEDDSVGGDTNMREGEIEDGSYVLNVLGAATDTGWTDILHANLGTAAAVKPVTVSLGNALATWGDGAVLIPVFVSGTRGTGFHALWEAVDGTAELGRDYLLGQGVVEWTSSSQGTKYVSIPLDALAGTTSNRTFQVRLTKVYGGTVGTETATVTLYGADARGGSESGKTESEWSAGARVDGRAGKGLPLFTRGDEWAAWDTAWDGAATVRAEVARPDGTSTVLGEASDGGKGRCDWDASAPGWYLASHEAYDGEGNLLGRMTAELYGIGAVGVVLTEATTVGADDTRLEGKAVVVDGCTLTLNGTHHLFSLIVQNHGKVTHTQGTAATNYWMDVTADSEIRVSADSQFDVTGKGYPAGYTAGNTTEGASQWVNGGSHGGVGGKDGDQPSYAVGATYGSALNPWTAGAGGGSEKPNWGGGLVRLHAPLIVLDGIIQADGQWQADNYRSGGAGGGVLVDAGTLSGTGSIRANGGGTIWYDCRGGGGRVAVYYDDASGFDLTKVTANAGTNTTTQGSNGAYAQNGTVWLQQRGEPGVLTGVKVTIGEDDEEWEGVDFVSRAGTLEVCGTHALGDVTVDGGTLTAAGGGWLEFSGLTLTNGSRLAAKENVRPAVPVDVTVSGTLAVSGDSWISANDAGYLAGYTFDAEQAVLAGATNAASLDGRGGGYGGRGGGRTEWQANETYGDYRNPDEPGSGGSQARGGGLVRVQAGHLHLEEGGGIRANATLAGDRGRGSGGGICVDAGTISGGGRMEANGRSAREGAGGGGRIALYAGVNDGFDTSRLEAKGGTNSTASGYAQAETGTVYVAEGPRPLHVRSVTPRGYVAEAAAELWIEFDMDVDETTFSADDVSVTDPAGGTVALAGFERENARRWKLTPAAPLAMAGEYVVRAGPDVQGGLFGAGMEGAEGDSVMMLADPPEMPTVEGWTAGNDVTNWVTASPVSLSGTRTDGTALWADDELRVVAGDGDWSWSATFAEGERDVSFWSVDRAGTHSETNTYHVYVDLVAPVAAKAEPEADADFHPEALPTQIEVQFTETGSGMDWEETSLAVTKNGAAVEGTWTHGETNAVFVPSAGFGLGTWELSVTPKDRAGNTGAAFTSRFTVTEYVPPTWYVDAATGSDANDGSEGHPLASIQAAIGLAAEGDRILVGPGTYAPIDTSNKVLRIIGTAGPKNTVIDGRGSKPCATLGDMDVVMSYPWQLTTNSVLEGFTLRNGFGVGYDSASGGGALGGTLVRCVVKDCRAEFGAGGYLTYMESCLVTGNYGQYGAGAYGGKIVNCTVVGNYADNSCSGAAYTEVYNSIVWGDGSDTLDWDSDDGGVWYSCVDGRQASDGPGLVLSDPLFADADDGDYSLQATSPCVDAGQPMEFFSDLDLAGNPRVEGNAPDMGAYEWADRGIVAKAVVKGRGTVEPEMAYAEAGDDVTFTALDDGLHGFAGWYVNGTQVGTERTYTISGITENTQLKAVFEPTTLWVDAATGSDTTGTGAEASPLAGIQAAIAKAGPGDEIRVGPGTYGPINTDDQVLHIVGTAGASETVIDAGGTERCAVLGDLNKVKKWMLTTNSVLEGFTLRNGFSGAEASDWMWGSADRYGGGAYGGTLVRCVVTGCRAPDGGGTYGSSLESCLVTGNTAEYGGGIGSGEAVNCTIVYNTATETWGTEASDTRVYNTILWGGGEYSTEQMGAMENSCVDSEGGADPKFVDAANGDYRLLAGSPCLDAGAARTWRSNLDLAGNARVQDGTVDIGAYEGRVLPMVHVTVTVSGNGTVEPMEASVMEGQSVTLTATPADGWAFVEWQQDGAVAGTEATLALENLQASVALTAVFGELVEVTATVSGNGTVAPTTATVVKGQSVTLTATPAEGAKFVEWQQDGATVGTEATLTLQNVQASTEVTAVFADLLRVNVTVSGTGTVEPPGAWLDVGESVILTATTDCAGAYWLTNGVFAGHGASLTVANVTAGIEVTLVAREAQGELTLSGAVLDGESRPVEGVTVRAWTAAAEAGSDETLLGSTASESGTGWWGIGVPEGWTGRVEAQWSCGTFTPAEVTFSALATDAPATDFVVAGMFAPEAPVPSSPVDGAYAVNTAKLTWSDGGCAERYEVLGGVAGGELSVLGTTTNTWWDWTFGEEGTYEWKVRAGNAGGEWTASAVQQFKGLNAVVVTGEVSVAAGDDTYEGLMVLADGAKMSFDGVHRLKGLILTNGATVTHPACTAGVAHALDLVLDRMLWVGADSAVDVTGKGWPKRVGGMEGTSSASYGGTHGGQGGASNLQPYGEQSNPNEPGGGGYNSAGGGVVRIQAREMMLDGPVLANGATNAAQTGAGGSIWLDAGVLSGRGTVHATGGRTMNTTSYSGGGGRIALWCATNNGFSTGTQLSVADGGGTSNVGTPGTIWTQTGNAPVRIVDVAPTGWVTSLETWTVRFNQDVDEASFGTDDATMEGPAGNVAATGVAKVDERTYQIAFEPTTQHGRHYLKVGPAVQGALFGTQMPNVEGGNVMLLSEPPAKPSVNGWTAGEGSTNWVTVSSLTLTGTRTDETSLWVDDVQRVAAGNGSWSWTSSYSEGERDMRFWSVDMAGNASETNTYHVFVDCTKPVVAKMTPRNGAYFREAESPAQVEVQFRELGSGMDWGETSLAMTKDGVAVEGTWTHGETNAVFTPSEAFGLGTWQVSATPKDRSGNTGPLATARFTVTDLAYDTEVSSATTVGTDGTALEGKSVLVNGTTLTLNGTHHLANLWVVNGGKVTHDATTDSWTGYMDVTAHGTIWVESGSSIDAVGKGYGPGRTWPNNTTAGGATGSAGGSHGGYGGDYHNGGKPGEVYDDFRYPTLPGAGGSSGAPGGGVIVLTADVLTIDGTVTAAGESNSGSLSSAGAGGSVRLNAGTLGGTGHISAAGGIGRPAYYYSVGGGGGRVSVAYETLADGFVLEDRVDVSGGGANYNNTTPAGSGTLYVMPTGEAPVLKILRGSSASGGVSALYLPDDAEGYDGLAVLSGNGLTVRARAGLAGWTNAEVRLENQAQLEVWNPLTVRTLTLTNGATATHPAATTNVTFALNLVVTDTLSVAADSAINVTGKGYRPGRTYRNETAGASSGRAGGSHGGEGGVLDGLVGATYGDMYSPIWPGGGSGTANTGSAGGGVVRIIAGTIELEGRIVADGANPPNANSAGGAGGSVYVEVTTLKGAGWMTASGGGGPGNGQVGGGGGRIAVYYNDISEFDVDHLISDGGTSGPSEAVAGDGTVYVGERVPVRVLRMMPEGVVTTAVECVRLQFPTLLRAETFGTDALTVTGPSGAVAVTNVEQVAASELTGSEWVAWLDGGAHEEGTYSLTLAPVLVSVAGMEMLEAYTNWLRLDWTAPAAPVLDGWLAAPDTNLVTVTSVALGGTRQEPESIYVNGTLRAAEGDAPWSWTTGLSQGLNTFRLTARDEAGLESEAATYLFWADNVAPYEESVTPANGTMLAAGPSSVVVRYRDATTGVDASLCSLAVTRNGASVGGTTTVEANQAVFVFAQTPGDGTYVVRMTLTDVLGNQRVQETTFTVDTTPPAAPLAEGVLTPTTIASQTLHGWKEAGTTLWINGRQRDVSQSATNWSTTVGLEGGNNEFVLFAKDAAGNQSASTTVVIYYQDNAPGEVTITADGRGNGFQVRLAWPNYSEYANGNDISYYKIFMSGSEFTNSTQAELVGTANRGAKSYVVGGLDRNLTYWFAVSAMDVSGNERKRVTSVSATTMDVVPPKDTTNVWFESGASNLVVRWSPAADGEGDLAGYIVKFDADSGDGEIVPATGMELVVSRDNLLGGTVYPVRVRSFDQDGNVSTGYRATGGTWLSNPTVDVVDVYEGTVELAWARCTPTNLLRRYGLYMATEPFESVEGRTPLAWTTDLSYSVTDLDNDQTYWFAVAAENISGGTDPAVTTATAMPRSDTEGPEIGNLRWEGNPVTPATRVRADGTLSVSATDRAGVARIDIRVDGRLLGSSGGSTNATAEWKVSATEEDGPYEVEVRALDTKGNESVMTTELTVQLATPTAPAITSPTAEKMLSKTRVSVAGTGAKGTDTVNVYLNDVLVAQWIPASDGGFAGYVTLGEGVNRLKVAGVNRAGQGPFGTPVRVIVDSSVPESPATLKATAQEGGTVKLTWAGALGAKGYWVYRSRTPFDNYLSATRVNTKLVTTTTHTDETPLDTTYYYRVMAVNSVGTGSDLSEQAMATSDRVPPTAALSFKTAGAKLGETYGRGLVTVTVTTSEKLQAVPFLSLTVADQSPITPMLRQSAADECVYNGIFEVGDATPTGLALASFSGRDVAGNRGMTITGDASIELDSAGPQMASLTVSPAAPIQNDSDSPAHISVTAVFSPSDLPAETPVLRWSLAETGMEWTPVALTQAGSSGTWTGSFDLPATAGNPADMLRFAYEGRDELGNAGTTIGGDSQFLVYQGELPVLDPPGGLEWTTGAAGLVGLTWRPVAGASGYAVFRGPSADALAPVGASATTAWEELAGDATNYYAVASLRTANGQVSTGMVGSVVRVISDATPPDAPDAPDLFLTGGGLYLTWAPVNANYYEVYRGVACAEDVSDLTAIEMRATLPAAVDKNPSQGTAYYQLRARDAVGNVSALSACSHTNLSLLPVSSLKVRLEGTNAPVLTWTHSAADHIGGFNVYVGTDGMRGLEATTDSATMTYTDESYLAAPGERSYGVTAVDAGTRDESVVREVRLPMVSAMLRTNQMWNSGVMNRIWYDVANMGTQNVSGLKLEVDVYGETAESAPFAVAAGGTAEVSVMIGGHQEATNAVSAVLTNRLTGTLGAGEIEIGSSDEIGLGASQLALEVLHSELLRGSDSRVRFRLRNTSDEDIELVMGGAKGKPGEVEMRLENADGMALARTWCDIRTGSGVSTMPDGRTVARIPAGESYQSAYISLPVPAGSPDAVWLVADVKKLYYHIGWSDEVEMPGLSARKAVSLNETVYRTEATEATPAFAIGKTNVVIRGRAYNRNTGAGQGNVPVKVIIMQNGFESVHTVTTDNSGNWTLDYVPSVGGIYGVCAIHPSETTRSEQIQFQVVTVDMTSSLSVTQRRGQTTRMSVTMKACADFVLTNATVVVLDEDQPGGALMSNVTVRCDTVLDRVVGDNDSHRGLGTVEVTLTPGMNAPDSGTIILRVVSENGPPEGWGKVPVYCQFVNSEASMNWSPSMLDTGIKAGGAAQASLSFWNSGFIPLRGVVATLTAADGSAPPSWVRMATSPALGDVEPKERRQVLLSYTPGTDVEDGTYEFHVLFSADNYSTQLVRAYVTVTTASTGGAQFKVTDLYTGTIGLGGTITEGLAGALVRLQREGSYMTTNLTTDAQGEVWFRELPEGSYRYTVQAKDHEQSTGRVWIQPGATQVQSVFLNLNLVEVEFTVKEITITDSYTIDVQMTFRTDVPFPVVTIEPLMIDLSDLRVGDTYYGEFRLENHGLVRADEVSLSLPGNNGVFLYELMREPPEHIEAKEALTIPFRVTRIRE